MNEEVKFKENHSKDSLESPDNYSSVYLIRTLFVLCFALLHAQADQLLSQLLMITLFSQYRDIKHLQKLVGL